MKSFETNKTHKSTIDSALQRLRNDKDYEVILEVLESCTTAINPEIHHSYTVYAAQMQLIKRFKEKADGQRH